MVSLLTPPEEDGVVSLSGSALITAARQERRSDMAKLLKRRWWHSLGIPGTQVDAVDDVGNTALHYATRNNDGDSVRQLLEAGARSDVVNQCEGTALHVAFAQGSESLIDQILVSDNGASANIASPTGGATPLHLAVKHGRRGFVKRLLQLGADPNAKDLEGSTPLDLALYERAELAIITALIHYGGVGDLDAPYLLESRLLYRAILDDYPGVVTLLLAGGVDVNHPVDSEGLPPLSIALAYQRPVIAVQLIDAHADLGRDSQGNTPLHRASRKGYVDIVRRLLVCDAAIDSLDDRGITPVGIAAECGHLAVIKTLLAEQANPRGILTLAAANGRLDIVEHLLLGDYAIDINEQPEAGRSPLRAALQYGHSDVANFLRSYGAAPL